MAIGTVPATRQATIIHRDQFTELHVPYDRAFLSLLKTTVPFTFRQYNPIKQVWTILHPYRSRSEQCVLSFFPDALVSGTVPTAGREASYEAAKAAEREAARLRREARNREKHEQARRDEAERLRRKREQEEPRQSRQEEPRRQHVHHRPTSADHELLGVSINVTLPVLEAAYRALSKQHHPDRGGDAETMKAINLAYVRIKRTLK